MPRRVILTENVRRRLCLYIYNITVNPNIGDIYKVSSYQCALDKAKAILDNLYKKLSIDCVTFNKTQLNTLGKKYGYREYRYKDKKTDTVWLFGCDTMPSFNFVMIMENGRLCVSHNKRAGNIITDNKQHNTMKNTKQIIRLTESQLCNIIKQTLKESMNNEDVTSFGNAMIQRYNHSSRKDWDIKEKFKDMSSTFINKSLETQKLIDGLIDNIYMYESVCSTRMKRSFFWNYYDVLKKMKKDFSLNGPVMMTLANWYNGSDDYWDKHNPDDDNYETEDWYERNEHGDFDTY